MTYDTFLDCIILNLYKFYLLHSCKISQIRMFLSQLLVEKKNIYLVINKTGYTLVDYPYV